MNQAQAPSNSFLLGGYAFLPDQSQAVNESTVYKTTSGAEFKCRKTNEKSVERLYCSLCSEHKRHIMESRPLQLMADRLITDARGIIDMRPNDVLLLAEGVGGFSFATDVSCARKADPITYNNHSEHEDLTKLSQQLTVHCAKKLPQGQSSVEPECGRSVKLSELPDHYHGEHAPLPLSTVTPSLQPPNWEILRNDLSTMINELNVTKNVFDASQTEIQRSRERIIGLENLNQQQAGEIKQLDAFVKMLSVTCSDYEIQINDLEKLRTDGTLLWKIENFDKAYADAVTGKKTSFYSPYFYSKPDGYKMCGRIYPNGDGIGKGNSLSLFLIIMKSANDDVLGWPFKKKVTFEIIGESGKVLRSDCFVPDPTSSSFKRPATTTEENIASGFPLFLPKNEIKLINGNLFIKIKVG